MGCHWDLVPDSKFKAPVAYPREPAGSRSTRLKNMFIKLDHLWKIKMAGLKSLFTKQKNKVGSSPAVMFVYQGAVLKAYP